MAVVVTANVSRIRGKEKSDGGHFKVPSVFFCLNDEAGEYPSLLPLQ